MQGYKIDGSQVKFRGRVLEYPDGSYDIMGAERAIFGAPGYEASQGAAKRNPRTRKETPDPEDLERARRRARANVRRLALANDFRWFVTLTIDPDKVDSFDAAAVVKRMSQWASNQVKRRGLVYVLVPEYHKSGRIHFHGFFNDVLEAVDSGHTDALGHKVYNLPGWGYGFTTAIELYGDRHAAVGYVTKYIGKESQKIGGRWYYSGGKLQKPVEKYVEIDPREILENYPRAWKISTPNGYVAGANGVKGETT